MGREGGFGEAVADVGAVAIAKALPLDHQHKYQAAGRIGPALRAPRAAVAEGARREQPGHALRFFDDAPPQTPAVAGRKASDNSRRVDFEHFRRAFWRKQPHPVKCAAA